MEYGLKLGKREKGRFENPLFGIGLGDFDHLPESGFEKSHLCVQGFDPLLGLDECGKEQDDNGDFQGFEMGHVFHLDSF